MSIPVALRGDFDAASLRRLARGSKDANQARSYGPKLVTA